VDFSTEMVIGVWGTGIGFTTFLIRADGTDGYLVTYQEQLQTKCPQTGCPPWEAWRVVVVRKTAGQVGFQRL
jgi:hypothetical protein